MVAEKTIGCAVVCVPAETSRMDERHQARFRPSDLVPWADPYIASLVHKLQREVREERQAQLKAERDAAPAWAPCRWDGEAGDRVLNR